MKLGGTPFPSAAPRALRPVSQGVDDQSGMTAMQDCTHTHLSLPGELPAAVLTLRDI